MLSPRQIAKLVSPSFREEVSEVYELSRESPWCGGKLGARATPAANCEHAQRGQEEGGGRRLRNSLCQHKLEVVDERAVRTFLDPEGVVVGRQRRDEALGGVGPIEVEGADVVQDVGADVRRPVE